MHVGCGGEMFPKHMKVNGESVVGYLAMDGDVYRNRSLSRMRNWIRGS